MRVTAQDIAIAFRDLRDGVRSREDVAQWASAVRAADDAEGIQYEPPAAGPAIWDALEFLIGVDLKDAPDSYLHGQKDFDEYWSSKAEHLLRLR